MENFQLDKQVVERRSNDFNIQPIILNRWSPRAFLEKPVPDKELMAVLDAARWAPSCFNEQPWRFLITRKKLSLEKMQSCLNEQNQIWANKAPVLIACMSQSTFARNDKQNRWHSFDAGAAWGYLALEAKSRGMIAHAMGGFDQEKVRALFNVPMHWEIHAVIALGYQGLVEQLPDDLKNRELPSTRKPLPEIWMEDSCDLM